ncbi:carbohydrate esterase family 16 protein [Piromyces sp. E2]|nr:carbohydrate esterase family 16 protein [Piromyces sp. E2]|eukprot:OUM57569.1 carbohydrate esterase family 16 protein [Piromyces sp. E2]
MKNLISFGDSYTTTNVDYETMISPGRDYTSSYGPNWIYHICDATGMKSYNFAYGGATISSAITTPYKPDVESFVSQVRRYFNPKMTKGPFTDWNSYNTLFGIWYGVNDNHPGQKNTDIDYEDYLDISFLIYHKLLEELYGYGARNFLLLNTPDIDTSPLARENPSDTRKSDLLNFNRLLVETAKEFYHDHPDINLFIYDTYTEFQYIYKNYKKYGITEVSEICPNLQYPDETCLPPEKYYWGDSLHPTHVVHKAMTDDIVKFLKKI